MCIYKLALTNESNSVEIVVNPNEISILDITFPQYRLSLDYSIKNSQEKTSERRFF